MVGGLGFTLNSFLGKDEIICKLVRCQNMMEPSPVGHKIRGSMSIRYGIVRIAYNGLKDCYCKYVYSPL